MCVCMCYLPLVPRVPAVTLVSGFKVSLSDCALHTKYYYLIVSKLYDIVDCSKET